MSGAAAGGPMQQPATWSLIAAGYAEETAALRVFPEAALELAAVTPGTRVLDVASGPGALALAAAERGARVCATDFAPGMVAKLRETAAERGLTGLDAEVMDAQQLSFEDGRFDAAFCLFGFMFFPDRARAFRELHRVVKPGGCAVIATWAPIERRTIMKLGFESLAEAMPELPRPQKGELQEPAECIAEMGAAGFRDVTTLSVVGTASFPSAEAYVRMLERTSGPLTLLASRMGDEAWSVVRQRVIESVQRRVPGTGPFELSAEALLTCGRR